MTWLVTGGAGYIGSHVVRALLDANLRVAVIDDLSTGHRAFVPTGVPFTRGSILDGSLVGRVIDEHDVTGVVHVAGFKYAGVSVQRPLHAYDQNVDGMTVLLAAMEDREIDRMVFSSSASVFGSPTVKLVTEETPRIPANPYGETKLIGEWLLRDQEIAVGLRHTALRYFNVIGSGTPEVYDASPHNILPMVFDALLEGRTPRINGNDYPTPDGTPIRDFVHVADIALAHVAAARRLDAGEPLEPGYNLGSGTGVSVAEVMAAIARATGMTVKPEIGPRRAGDPARLVGSGELAARDLDWQVRHTLDEAVTSAWAARQAAISSDGES